MLHGRIAHKRKKTMRPSPLQLHRRRPRCAGFAKVQGLKSLLKTFRHDFFWPTALEEAKELVQKCKGCQIFRSKPLLPASALKTIPIAWPFVVWGLDMVGPLRTNRSGFTHVLVAVDKFTKWIEAKPIKNLDASTAVSFIRELTFRYGVPHSIITDNGSNFDSDEFRIFCASQGT